MKSCIAILTYRRLHAIQSMMAGIERFCPQYTCSIWEDCGQRDSTSDWLTKGRRGSMRRELMAKEWSPIEDTGTGVNQGTNWPNARVFLGECNLGVTGNSNRALSWFMNGPWDHLLLCNDDVFVTGGVTLASLQPELIHQVVGTMDRFKLDFDDAYQYVAAEQAQAVIVSYDDDFDRTARGRTTPAQVLNNA